MSYDIGGGYDGWKTATPWDDEVETTVSFECEKCEHYNEDITVVVGRGSEDAPVECEECGVENNADLGGD
jgi:transcription elongation factor Elf1